MRRPSLRDGLMQGALAAVALVPLCAGFAGAGSFDDVFGSAEPGALVSRRALLFEALARSSWIGLGAVAVALVFGVPAAWLLSRRKRSLFFLALCALPLALAPSAAVSGWLQWWAAGSESLGGARPELTSAFRQLPAGGMTGLGAPFSVSGVALILGLGLWPIMALEVWPAFVRVRGEAYEAALLAGSPLRAFFRIALPMARGELAAAGLLVFLLAASDFTVSSLLLVRTLPIEVHDYLSQGRTAAAAWAAAPLVLLTVAAAWLLTRVHARAPGLGADAAGAARPPQAAAAGAGSGAMVALGLLLGFVLPLSGCLYGAGSGVVSWRQAFGVGLDPLGVSLRLALAAGLVAVVLGALRIACWPEVRTPAPNGAALLLLVVPGSLLAGGLLALQVLAGGALDELGAQPLTQAFPAGMLLGLAYVLRFAYLPLRLAEEGLRALDPAMLEAAELAGTSRLTRGLAVALPQLWGHLLAAGALVFVLALGELPVSDKLAPPGAVPVSVWLFQQQHLGYTEAVFGLSLLVGAAACAGLTGAGLVGAALQRVGARRWETLVGGGS